MESKSANASRKPSNNILDKALSKGRGEINLSTFAFLFSEMVQYCQNRSSSVVDLQQKLAALGHHVGMRILDALYMRERGSKRELRLLQALIFVKTTVWKNCFGREADKLELSNDDEKTYYIIENESLVNKFIFVPKDKGSLNCAAFSGGIIEAILNGLNFPCTVTVHWHKGTTYMIKFEESVLAREKAMESR